MKTYYWLGKHHLLRIEMAKTKFKIGDKVLLKCNFGDAESVIGTLKRASYDKEGNRFDIQITKEKDGFPFYFLGKRAHFSIKKI
jgi:hypothetical protein